MKDKKKRFWEDAIRSFDISRHANAPEKVGNSKSLSVVKFFSKT